MKNSGRIIRAVAYACVVSTLSQCGFLGNAKVNATQAAVLNSGPTNPITTPTNSSGPTLSISSASPATQTACWVGNITYLVNGVAAAIPSATVVGLAGPASVTFFSAADCNAGSQVSQTTIPANGTSASFWMKFASTGTISLSATVVSGSPATAGTASVTVQASQNSTVPVILSLSGASTIGAGNCVAYSATLLDVNNNPTPFTSKTTLSLADGNGGGQFFTLNTCTAASQVTSIPVPASQATIGFFYARNSAGTAILAGTAGGVSGNKTVIVNAGGPDHLAFAGPVLISTGQCVPYGVQVHDKFANTTQFSPAQTVTLIVSGQGALFSDSICKTPLSSLSLSSTQVTGTFYFQSAVQGSASIAGTSPGVQGANRDITINPAGLGTAAQLAFHVFPQAPDFAGFCYGPIEIEVQDSTGKTFQKSSQRKRGSF